MDVTYRPGADEGFKVIVDDEDMHVSCGGLQLYPNFR